ncbi:hypothetical protein CNMCM5793_007439 [Aspergillus hiratsukae]|uniref:7-dehydrocholesterol reductase n=1 Tax=Aspergillus hiratsukae TaxID=1194566 RepID=A0A8H6UBZ3_9EURO|nr:hypothetical protein CNMCM5793_007439 [Aspergillus hiratsukae]
MKRLHATQRVEPFSIAATLSLEKYHRASRKPSLLADSTVSNRATWGRSSLRHSWLRTLFSSAPVVLAPLLALSCFLALAGYEGSLSKLSAAILQDGLVSVLRVHGPSFTVQGMTAMICWLAFQAMLFYYLPGPTNTGQRTPAGHLLTYRTNGLLAWVITHVVFASLCCVGILDPGFVPRNWGGLFAAMNLAGFLLSSLAYLKAYLMPTHPEDRTFSGCALFDFYMGIELNPRIGHYFDLKLYTNGRPGLIAWTLTDLSNIAYHYQTHHHFNPSLILVTILHSIYVLDFFINEAWYLRTIDIAHDHYGFYLAWGCITWVPSMYTLQAQYLGLYPTSVSPLYLLLIFGTGIAGYALFRSVNSQKDRVRRSRGKALVWGKPAEFIRAKYRTLDGMEHESILLCSGWWGWSRHANYVGDLLLSFAMCALVSTSSLLVWFYITFMAILLVHRCLRDEERGRAKYGLSWEEYCRKVPWRLVPRIW